MVAGQRLSARQIATLLGRKKQNCLSSIRNMARDGILIREDGDERTAFYSLPKKSERPPLTDLLKRLWRPTQVPAEAMHCE
jgi:hypothetical protein